MSRFDIFELRVPARIKLVVTVQADLFDDLRTRVVIPLIERSQHNAPLLAKAMPVVMFQGEEHVLLTPEIGTLSTQQLGVCCGSLADQQQIIVDALDFLFLGF
jgi:toxin CcdB